MSRGEQFRADGGLAACETESMDLSIVICTKDRAESLSQLLSFFSADDHLDFRVEVMVVDNNSTDHTREMVESFRDVLAIRYLLEKREGKCHALNRALDEGPRGRIVAFVDDDIALEPGWFRRVMGVCDRWPSHDIFGGRSHVIFPENVTIPAWARDQRFHRVAFSVRDHGEEDVEFPAPFFPMAGHFWVRSRVLQGGRRFPERWLTEPGFLIGLQEDGFRGVSAGDVLVGHRIQPHLLQKSTILKRVANYGRELPYVLLPNVRISRQARWFRDHPYVWTFLCLMNSMRWLLRYARVFLIRDPDERFKAQVEVLDPLNHNWATVRHFRRIRESCQTVWARKAAYQPQTETGTRPGWAEQKMEIEHSQDSSQPGN